MQSDPAAYLWETQEGEGFLRRLLICVTLLFGINHNIGAPTIRQFIQMLGLDNYIACSETAIRDFRKLIEDKVENIADEFHEQANKNEEVIDMVLCNDEVFFGDNPILVSIEGRSNMIVLEQFSENRKQATWAEAVKDKLPQKHNIRYTVSDKARALLALGNQDLDSIAFADLFHHQYAISKHLGKVVGQNHQRSIRQVQETELLLQQASEGSTEKEVRKERLEQARQTQLQAKEQQEKYSQAQQGISLSVHPFDLQGNSKTPAVVLEEITEHTNSLEQLASELKHKKALQAIENSRKDLDLLSQITGVWWEQVLECFPEKFRKYEHWAMEVLFPLLYWETQLNRCDSSKIREKYKEAYQYCLEKYRHSDMPDQIPEEQFEELFDWMEQQVDFFQRTSSAVEGRNGRLSQLFHNGRGLTQRSLKIHTIIHNFTPFQPNKISPAEKFYGVKPPNIFQDLLKQIQEIPKPRKRAKGISRKTFFINSCPALRG